MINFFRKTRKKLADDNKPVKYFRYAIGEIALVVIGILIALSINNWNKNRLDKNFETVMLKEVKSSLESDWVIYEIIKARMSLKKEGIQELLQMRASNNIYADSVLLKVYNKMSMGVVFNYDKGGYEAIKSVGLDKISNDTLRKELIKTYESHYPRFESFFNLMEDDITNKEYKLNLHNKLWKRIQIQMPDKSFKLVSVPINIEAFLNQSELIDRIKIAQDNLNKITYRQPFYRYIIENALEHINKELND